MPLIYTTETYVKRVSDIYQNKYDYSLVVYINSHVDIDIICPIHGVFTKKPYHHLKQGCPVCSKLRQNRNTSLTTDQFIKNAIEVHGNKYDYSLVEYKNNKTKVKIICKEHGVFEQTPNNHISKQHICGVCKYNNVSNKLQITTDEFNKRCETVHGNKYDYSLVVLNGTKRKVSIICPTHGMFTQTIGNHIGGQGCPCCMSSKGESRVSSELKTLNISFIREYTFNNLIGGGGGLLRFDFYLPEYNTCIEYDGEYHYKSIADSDLQKQQLHDNIKNKYCIANDIRLLRIPYTEFLNIEEKIKVFINGL